MTADDARVAGAVSRWFALNARDLPWRTRARGQRDPYRALVAEFMLQQTQVSRVIKRFGPFLEKFPTIGALAAADEDAVLTAWSGLGYYRRARMLHAAARAVAGGFGGRVPGRIADLRSLPGVGRYTAGAIASIVFGSAEPIVDGNVLRVLARLDGAAGPPDEARAWERAGTLVGGASRPDLFNEGLMELGATVCTPRAPRCASCPLAGVCVARAQGTQEQIPAPRSRPARRPLYICAAVAVDGRGRVLMEQRGGGLWARMWQAPALERDDWFAGDDALCTHIRAAEVEEAGSFEFLTTHRRVLFAVYRARGARAGGGRMWVSGRAMAGLAVSNAQRKVLAAGGWRSPDRSSPPDRDKVRA